MRPAPSGASIPPRRSADLGYLPGAAGRVDRRGNIPVDVHRVPLSGVKWEVADEWEAKPIQYRFRQDARQLRGADAVELPCAHRCRVSQPYQRRLRGPRLYLGGDL